MISTVQGRHSHLLLALALCEYPRFVLLVYTPHPPEKMAEVCPASWSAMTAPADFPATRQRLIVTEICEQIPLQSLYMDGIPFNKPRHFLRWRIGSSALPRRPRSATPARLIPSPPACCCCLLASDRLATAHGSAQAIRSDGEIRSHHGHHIRNRRADLRSGSIPTFSKCERQ